MSSQSAQWYRENAWRFRGSAQVDFDDEPEVSIGEDDGAYVQCWLWVSDPDPSDPEYEGASHPSRNCNPIAD